MPHQGFHSPMDGVFPRLLEILGYGEKPWLDKWKEKSGAHWQTEETSCANAIGTAFHAGAEALSRGKNIEYPANRRVGKMLERVQEWLDATKFRPIKTLEFHVVSAVHGYHGTLDAVGMIGKCVVLVDYKSSSAILPRDGGTTCGLCPGLFRGDGAMDKERHDRAC